MGVRKSVKKRKRREYRLTETRFRDRNCLDNWEEVEDNVCLYDNGRGIIHFRDDNVGFIGNFMRTNPFW